MKFTGIVVLAVVSFGRGIPTKPLSKTYRSVQTFQVPDNRCNRLRLGPEPRFGGSGGELSRAFAAVHQRSRPKIPEHQTGRRPAAVRDADKSGNNVKPRLPELSERGRRRFESGCQNERRSVQRNPSFRDGEEAADRGQMESRLLAVAFSLFNSRAGLLLKHLREKCRSKVGHGHREPHECVVLCALLHVWCYSDLTSWRRRAGRGTRAPSPW